MNTYEIANHYREIITANAHETALGAKVVSLAFTEKLIEMALKDQAKRFEEERKNHICAA